MDWLLLYLLSSQETGKTRGKWVAWLSILLIFVGFLSSTGSVAMDADLSFKISKLPRPPIKKSKKRLKGGKVLEATADSRLKNLIWLYLIKFGVSFF